MRRRTTIFSRLFYNLDFTFPHPAIRIETTHARHNRFEGCRNLFCPFSGAGHFHEPNEHAAVVFNIIQNLLKAGIRFKIIENVLKKPFIAETFIGNGVSLEVIVRHLCEKLDFNDFEKHLLFNVWRYG